MSVTQWSSRWLQALELHKLRIRGLGVRVPPGAQSGVRTIQIKHPHLLHNLKDLGEVSTSQSPHTIIKERVTEIVRRFLLCQTTPNWSSLVVPEEVEQQLLENFLPSTLKYVVDSRMKSVSSMTALAY